mgnify:CR=1 FL=1
MIYPKKSLGQNFLIDENIINKISNVIDIKDKRILEVGPGTGNLTSSLLKKKPSKLFVVEKDSNLASILENKFNDQVTIVNEDILAYENLIQRIQSPEFKKAIQEIKSGRKTSHWAWWAFPTEKTGFSEPVLKNKIKTKLTPETFKLFLINLPKPWINLMNEIIKRIKEGFRVIDLFPEIDHDRIKYFIIFF